MATSICRTQSSTSLGSAPVGWKPWVMMVVPLASNVRSSNRSICNPLSPRPGRLAFRRTRVISPERWLIRQDLAADGMMLIPRGDDAEQLVAALVLVTGSNGEGRTAAYRNFDRAAPGRV